MQVQRFDLTPRLCDMVTLEKMVFVSGQVPATVDAPVEVQTREVLDRLDAMLARAGTDKSRLLTATVYVTDMAHYAGFNSVWDAWVDRENPPARDCFVVGLANPGWKVEIVATAYRP